MPKSWEQRPPLAAAIRAFFDASALMDPLRLRIWDAAGLTVTQLRLLVHLHEQEGLSNAALADRLYVTRPSVSALLERLERGGFIRREVAPNDRRAIRIWLEERGRVAVANLTDEVWEYAARLIESLPDKTLTDIATGMGRFVEAGRTQRTADLATESATAE